MPCEVWTTARTAPLAGQCRTNSSTSPRPGTVKVDSATSQGSRVGRVRCRWRPRQDSNLRTWLRRPLLYPLSYEGGKGEGTKATSTTTRMSSRVGKYDRRNGDALRVARPTS